VLAAHTLLHTFVTQVNQLQETSKKVPGWTRINSHSTVKVDIANAKDAQTSQLDGLRKAPKVVADSTVCDEHRTSHIIELH
jgi:glutamate mutase epsilon subunit